MNSSRGRPSPPQPTRQRLVEAAQKLFLAQGYAQTSARAIAREAGVDHAMVNYYFGSKEGLFAETVSLLATPRDILDRLAVVIRTQPPDVAARRFAATVVAAWDAEGFREPMLAVLQEAMADDAARRVLAEFLEAEVLGAIRDFLPGPDVRARAAAIAAVVAGIVVTRFLIGMESSAALRSEELVRVVAPMLEAQLRR